MPRSGVNALPEYPVWAAMLQRCTNLKDKGWPRYGGKGVTVCERWRKFVNFYEDMGPRGDNQSLDRIDNTKGYSKENCRWTSVVVQAQNKGPYKTNQFGISGVVWRKDCKRYRAQIGAEGQQIVLGTFDTIDQAIAARRAGEQRYWNKPVEAVAA